MAVVCGNCTKSLGRALGCQVRHETSAEVKDCYERTYAFRDYYESKASQMRLNHGSSDFFDDGFDEWEAARGVVQFDVAYAQALAEHDSNPNSINAF